MHSSSLTTLISVVVLAVLQSLSSAQSPYIQNGTIGEPASKPTARPETGLPVDEWVGNRIVFMPIRKSSQKYGYQAFRYPLAPKELFSRQPKYDELVGKVGTITARPSRPLADFLVRLDDGQTLEAALTLGTTLEHVAFVDEIETARRLYLNQTLWLRDRTVWTYDAERDTRNVFYLPKFTPVRITNVVLSEDTGQPIRFIFSSEDRRTGFKDITLGCTNSQSYECSGNRFVQQFVTQDPRKGVDWPDSVWQAVCLQMLSVGMSKDQVVMSWGTPLKINRTESENGAHEQWVYERRHRDDPVDGLLYFDNAGKLTAIQKNIR
jgi:hypothetical protein